MRLIMSIASNILEKMSEEYSSEEEYEDNDAIFREELENDFHKALAEEYGNDSYTWEQSCYIGRNVLSLNEIDELFVSMVEEERLEEDDDVAAYFYSYLSNKYGNIDNQGCYVGEPPKWLSTEAVLNILKSII